MRSFHVINNHNKYSMICFGKQFRLSFIFAVLLSFYAGCAPMPSDIFIEDLVVARISHDYNWALANTYPGINASNKHGSGLTADENRLLHQMLHGHYAVKYARRGFNKYTTTIDLSNSDIIEWYNVNKLKTSSDFYITDKAIITESLIYRDNRWWLSAEKY